MARTPELSPSRASSTKAVSRALGPLGGRAALNVADAAGDGVGASGEEAGGGVMGVVGVMMEGGATVLAGVEERVSSGVSADAQPTKATENRAIAPHRRQAFNAVHPYTYTR